MYLSSSDDVNDGDADDNNTQIRQGNTPPVTSAPSQSSSPSCPTLLVIDDNSISDDLPSSNTTDIPSNSNPSNNETTPTNQSTQQPSVATIDVPKDTAEQQRRRNSSVAKLLVGQTLENEQYKGIHQQILDDQSAQNGSNTNDCTGECNIPRSRSSITRSLLLNSERNNSNKPVPLTVNKGPPSPEFSKNFEYLIRRELDIDHSSSALFSSPPPNVFSPLSTLRNTSPLNAQPVQSKFKRKRSHPKPTLPTPPPPQTSNKQSNLAPFSIREPFELDPTVPTLVSPLNPAHTQRSHHHQNDLFRFDPSAHPHHPHHRPSLPLPHQQPYPLPLSSPIVNSTAYPGHKLNSPAYPQFKLHHDRLQSTPSYSSSSSSSPSSSPYSYARYPALGELALPTPVSPLFPQTSSLSVVIPHPMGGSSRKTKVMHRPDMFEIPVHRPHSGISNHSNTPSFSSSSSSSSLSSPSSGHGGPLKKRLLDAYKNEQRPSSTL